MSIRGQSLTRFNVSGVATAQDTRRRHCTLLLAFVKSQTQIRRCCICFFSTLTYKFLPDCISFVHVLVIFLFAVVISCCSFRHPHTDLNDRHNNKECVKQSQQVRTEPINRHRACAHRKFGSSFNFYFLS